MMLGLNAQGGINVCHPGVAIAVMKSVQPDKEITMKQGRTLWIVALAATALLAGGATFAQDAAPAVQQGAQPRQDPRALDLLKGMSDRLARARSLSVTVRGLVPTAAPTGQYISLFSSSRVVMQRPDKLAVQSRGDLFPSDLYYDGRTVTAIGGGKRFYSQKEASGSTIDAILQNAHPGADILAQFAEILVADPYAAFTVDLSTALWVGQSTLGGVKVDHLAFTGKGLDWEIWIGARDQLPRLMLVAHREGERQPTFTVEFADWKLDLPTPARTFRAPIPKDAVKLDFKLQALLPSR
jgi:hypothetical protein